VIYVVGKAQMSIKCLQMQVTRSIRLSRNPYECYFDRVQSLEYNKNTLG